MEEKLAPATAKKFLADVPPDKIFYVFKGPTLRNMEQLAQALEKMSDEQFNHHRSDSKNDFYNWVSQVIGDKKLADDLTKAKTKAATAKKVKERVAYLKGIK
ncbi:MAG: hypothetical protein QW279_01845 [Candidatus Jordarchaeaceae archaeon]